MAAPAPKPPPLRIEEEQEAALIKKYGMKPKLSPRLLAKRRGKACFDSAVFTLQQSYGGRRRSCKEGIDSAGSVLQIAGASKHLCVWNSVITRSGKKCFDSADFALQQQGRLSTIVSGDLSVPEQPIETLAPKLSPTHPAPRRMSNLGDSD